MSAVKDMETLQHTPEPQTWIMKAAKTDLKTSMFERYRPGLMPSHAVSYFQRRHWLYKLECQALSSTGTKTSFSSSIFANDPS